MKTVMTWFLLQKFIGVKIAILKDILFPILNEINLFKKLSLQLTTKMLKECLRTRKYASLCMLFNMCIYWKSIVLSL